MPSAPMRSRPRYVAQPATFMGIVRPDGRVATRNYIGILTSVNCSATVARAVADYFRRDIRPEALADYPNVDGVVALTHGGGCAIDTEGEGIAILRRTLAGYARHPNFRRGADRRPRLRGEPDRRHRAGAEADCEPEAAEPSRSRRRAARPRPSRSASRGSRRLLPEANKVTREPVPASHLIVGSAVRRLGWLFGHLRQSRAGRCGGPAGSPRRYGDSFGDAGDLRRRASADAACGDRARWARSWSSASSGGPTTARATTRELEQQPVGRATRRADSPPCWRNRSVAWPRAAPATWSTSTNTPSRSRARASCSWIRPASIRSRQPVRSRAAPT